MKLKFDKIENENFILKSLRFQKEKTFHFGTCYDKHKNILSYIKLYHKTTNNQ